MCCFFDSTFSKFAFLLPRPDSQFNIRPTIKELLLQPDGCKFNCMCMTRLISCQSNGFCLSLFFMSWYLTIDRCWSSGRDTNRMTQVQCFSSYDSSFMRTTALWKDQYPTTPCLCCLSLLSHTSHRSTGRLKPDPPSWGAQIQFHMSHSEQIIHAGGVKGAEVCVDALIHLFRSRCLCFGVYRVSGVGICVAQGHFHKHSNAHAGGWKEMCVCFIEQKANG